MKKILYILAIVSLLLTGCATQDIIVEDMGEATNIRTSTENDISSKRKIPSTTTSETSSADNTVTTVTDTSAESKTSGTNAKTGTTDVQNSDVIIPAESQSQISPENSASEESTSSISKTTATENTTKPAEVYYLSGIVYEVQDKSIIINEADFKKMNISFSDNSMIADIHTGDRVEITYNGLINEGDINYAYDPYSIEVTEKADKKYKLEKFEFNDMAFSMLVPENWSSKEIDYPQEGDFTDWGIRFTPNGASGSMDITWHSSITITGNFDKIPQTINSISAKEYSSQGVWRFFVFDNNYVATNNFFGTSQYSDYAGDMELMINTIEFM